MQLPIFTALSLLTSMSYAAAMPGAGLAARDDCGAGQAPYTRRTNSPCNTFDHTYCGCDRTGVVSPHH